MKISDLAESSSLANGNYLLLLDGSNNKKAKLSTLKSFLGSGAALTGTPTAPTAAVGTSTTQIATTAFVNNTINNRFNITDITDQVTLTKGTNCNSVVLNQCYKAGNLCYIRFTVTPVNPVAAGGNVDITLSGVAPAYGADTRLGFGINGIYGYATWFTSNTNIRCRYMGNGTWNGTQVIFTGLFMCR